MKIDVTQEILGLDGKVRQQNGKPMTLRLICCEVLQAGFPDEPNLSGGDKLRRWKLATRIYNDKNPELSPEEVTELRALVAKAYISGVVGPAWELLDPKV